MAMQIIRSRIARRLVLSVLLASSLVTLATTALQLRTDYVSAVEQIEDNFDFIGSDSLGSLVESVWVNDNTQIQLQLNGLVNLPNMEHLAIRVDGQITWQAGELISDNVLSSSFPLLRSYRDQNLALGELRVTAGLDKLNRRLMESAGKILLNNAIEIFLVAGLLLLLFHFFVSQPLRHISDYLGSLDLDKPELPQFETKSSSKLRRRDEFDQVGDVINSMTAKLSASHRELENKVEERTKQLRDSEAFLNETGRVAKMGGWEFDLTTREIRWTSETYHIHQVPRDFKPTLAEALNFYHPDDKKKLSGAIKKAIDTATPYDLEIRLSTAKGKKLWIRTNCGPEVIEGKTVKLRGMFQDITERKLTENRVTRLGRIVERSLNEVYVFDADTLNFLEVNHGARTNLGYSMKELRALTPIDIKPEFTLKSFENHLIPLRHGEKDILVFETVHQRKDHTIYNVEVHLQLMSEETPPVFVAIIQDSTERKRMQELLMQTEKMMSVGGLAAGMAHELNNPLAGILQGIQNIERRLSPDLEKNNKAAQELGLDLSKVYSYFERRGIGDFLKGIRNSGERAAGIVENMFQFARKDELKLQPEQLNQLVEQALDLATVEYELKKKYDFHTIEIIREYDPTLPAVNCIASEIQQVLLNLLRNAVQAIYVRDQIEGSPHIKLRILRRDAMACIEVEDNGSGMDEVTRNHVFDPFFTTRQVGEGTGLGLSVSYFIVTQEHSGRMSVDSQLGKGTIFTICLPYR